MNIGIIGSGFIVPVFCENASKYNDYHLRGIWGRHIEKLELFKNQFEYITDDLEKLLNDKDIDVIYIALPNKLHYQYAKQVLNHNKHCIVEKPFTVYVDEAKELIDLAKSKNLIIYEAILTRHNPTYLKAKELINSLGDIKIIIANFSQYSRRYDRFKEGIILPVFDPKMAGGALLDLNVYNIHFVAGIFNKPQNIYYYPNIEKGVDTSGTLILDYGSFKASLTAAKDCKGDNFVLIEGDKGYLRCNTTASRCGKFTYQLNNQEPIYFGDEDAEFSAWKYELKDFIDLYNSKDLNKAYKLNQDTLEVQEILEKALKSAKLNY